MQFQIPQFIESEDTVVGPFSLRQFMYVGGAALVSAIFYFFVQSWLFFIIAFILVGGALAFSFIKIGGRPLLVVVRAAARFYWQPQTYVLKPDHAPTKTHETHEQESGGDFLESILAKSPLHKSWEGLQSGTPDAQKNSDKQFIERKMSERYQIFQRTSGERSAARRVDYR